MGSEGGDLYLPICKAVKKNLKPEFIGGRGLKDQAAVEHSFVSMREGVEQAADVQVDRMKYDVKTQTPASTAT